MALEPSAVLEVLRDHFHSPQPDLVELDAILHAARDRPGFELVGDYLVDESARQLRERSDGGWALVELASSHAPSHARLPTAEELDALLSELEGLRPASSLRLFTRFLRRGDLELHALTRRLGEHVLALDNAPLDEHVSAVVDCTTAILACAFASQSEDAHQVAERLCAFLRGVQRWNARGHALALLGKSVSLDPALAHTLFMALLERLTRDAEPYLQDRVRDRVIGMREVRFSPLASFVQVAMPAAAVADISRNRNQWSEERLVFVREAIWSDAASLLERCGVDIPPASDMPLEFHLEQYALLSGPDGSLAVQCAVAGAESLLAIGANEAAMGLASLVAKALRQVNGPPGYLDWARAVEKRAKAGW